MIGLALNIIAFIFVAYIIILLLGGILALFGTTTSSDSSGDSNSKRLLSPVMNMLSLRDGETISSTTSDDVLKKAIAKYYEILKSVFDTETPEQRKEILISHTSSGKLAESFFGVTGLGKSLTVLTKDIDHVIEGSGWVNYKKLLENSIGGTLKKTGNKKYQIIFNKNFYLNVEEYKSYSRDYDSEDEWDIEAFYHDKEVLSCYSPRYYSVHTFKPDIWILDVLKASQQYAALKNEYEILKSTERKESQLFA